MGSTPSTDASHLVAGAFIDSDGHKTEWIGGDPTIVHANQEPAPHQTPHARILVVEDEHLVALDIQLRLEQMGHLVEVVYTGEEALSSAATRNFDLALMDIKLKGELDGVETARRLHDSQDLPIIYLTAYADNHTLDRARVTEPYGYVLKPFQERELRAAIDMALHRHGTDRQRWEQQQVQRFLADASARLAMSLDYRAVALGAAELIVPRYAEWCTIHLKETNDQVPAFSFTRPNGEPRDDDHDDESRGRLIASVERTATSEILTQISDAGTLVDAVGPRHIDTLREVGARSLLCVPLVARNQVLGALALVSGRARPRYSVQDLMFVEDFARRLGMALDNALLYRAAERAIHMRDDVLAIVSHDLRTPLGTIVMEAEALATREGSEKAAAGISRAAHRMNRLIGDLLDASSINAGSVSLDVRTTSATELAKEALEMFRTQAEARSIELLEDLPELALRVVCDRDRVIQVLSNLVGNALKFTPRGGQVRLRVMPSGAKVRFEVHDTGPGIAAEHMPHLFDRFWHGKNRESGAGLGLFIARGIVAAHGSSLRVDTEIGLGSRFYFDLMQASF